MTTETKDGNFEKEFLVFTFFFCDMKTNIYVIIIKNKYFWMFGDISFT